MWGAEGREGCGSRRVSASQDPLPGILLAPGGGSLGSAVGSPPEATTTPVPRSAQLAPEHPPFPFRAAASPALGNEGRKKQGRARPRAIETSSLAAG